ncbi:S8 family peptidase [Pedobacter immunditicola]|uniref:S8 family peptidase n=1 Tax=Pedobacter immunditicola TaxID=3133440 RepID=UPI0030A6EEC6
MVLSVLFWFYLIDKKSSSISFTEQSAALNEGQQPMIIGANGSYRLPIAEEDIIIDDDQRQVVVNLVNIAIKDSVVRVDEFIHAFNTKFDVSKYKLLYADSTINYLQVFVPEADREAFKKSVKTTIPNMDLLVWDEVLFSRLETEGEANRNVTDNKWHLKEINVNPDQFQQLGKGVTIAVIDNGFDLNHPSLAGRIVSPYNAFNGGTNVSPASINHGSHVASIAMGNSSQVKGVCGTCKLMPIQVEDPNGYTSSSYVIRGILYAIKNNADVINLSLGLSFNTNEKIPLDVQEAFIKDGAVDETAFWKELFAYARKNKTVCVIAAGNSNQLTGFDPFQRSESTIKVGALDKNGHVASFSNYGKYTTLFAPGVDIIGAKPGNQSEMLDGTSMASPIVAGYIGLLKAKSPNATYEEIFQQLLANTAIANGNKVLKNKTLN